jgi:hypothetical protein
MSTSASIMMWAQRICAKRGQPAHVLLEVKKDATIEEATHAFHKIARIAHPDLHRNVLTPDELEMLTAAYAIVAGAYQTFRSQVMSTTQMKPIRDAGSGPTAAATEKLAVPSHVTPRGSPPGNAATAMSSKALVYYRKAEAALKRGDLKSAILQIKLAIATDPQSAFLRTALAEVEAEVAKGGR